MHARPWRKISERRTRTWKTSSRTARSGCTLSAATGPSCGPIVAPYAAGGERLHVSGPDIELDARAALSATMVLSELTTNAGKYGALSNASGVLTVTWSSPHSPGAGIELEWIEKGGPKWKSPRVAASVPG